MTENGKLKSFIDWLSLKSKAVDNGGYFADDAKTSAAVRPSATLNAIIG